MDGSKYKYLENAKNEVSQSGVEKSAQPAGSGIGFKKGDEKLHGGGKVRGSNETPGPATFQPPAPTSPELQHFAAANSILLSGKCPPRLRADKSRFE